MAMEIRDDDIKRKIDGCEKRLIRGPGREGGSRKR